MNSWDDSRSSCSAPQEGFTASRIITEIDPLSDEDDDDDEEDDDNDDNQHINSNSGRQRSNSIDEAKQGILEGISSRGRIVKSRYIRSRRKK